MITANPESENPGTKLQAQVRDGERGVEGVEGWGRQSQEQNKNHGGNH